MSTIEESTTPRLRPSKTSEADHCASFIINEVLPRLRKRGLDIGDSHPFTPALVGMLVRQERAGLRTRHENRETLDFVIGLPDLIMAKLKGTTS